jgi:F-type H+-transporting ATPase subunit alpha
MVELLKQDQYSPMPVQEQVAVLFAGTRGHLDDVEIARVREFEGGLVKFLRDSYSNLLADIIAKKQLDPELEQRLADAITDFKKKFI